MTCTRLFLCFIHPFPSLVGNVFFAPLKAMKFQNQSFPALSHIIKAPPNFILWLIPIHFTHTTIPHELQSFCLHHGENTLPCSCRNASLNCIIICTGMIKQSLLEQCVCRAMLCVSSCIIFIWACWFCKQVCKYIFKNCGPYLLKAKTDLLFNF